MKRVLLIVFLIIISFRISVEAQEIKYGFTAGLGGSGYSLRNSSTKVGYSVRTSNEKTYHINGFVTLKSDSWWGISLEPGYKEKGAFIYFEYNIDPHGFYYSVTKNYSIIELPIVWNAYLNHHFYTSTGLGFEYIINTTYEDFWSISNSNYSVGTILPDVENKFNCSGIIGLNYKLSNLLDLGVIYNLGLTRLMRVDLVDAIGYPYRHPAALNSFYCNSWQITLKYKMN